MQPGQMAYDRGSTVFSPDGRLFQVEYAREAVKKGSTTIGLKYKDGVALIVDRRSSSKLLEPRSTEKIHEIDDYIGCATSGLVADARILVDEARKNAQVHRVNYGENISVEMLVKKVCDSEPSSHTRRPASGTAARPSWRSSRRSSRTTCPSITPWPSD